MSRFIGIGLLLWALSVTFDYAVSNAPQAAAPATEQALLAESPIDVLVEASAETQVTPARRMAFTWSAGIYVVNDSDDPNARYDRDVKPRETVISEDEGFEGSGIPEWAQDLRGDIDPGLYATSFDTKGCTYELWRVMKNRQASVIGEEYLAEGRLLASIGPIEPDWFSSSPRCGRWEEWQPLAEPLTQATNGDYWTGDLKAGLWGVPLGCRWEKVVAFRGARLSDVIDSGGNGEALFVDHDTLGVRVRGCHAPLLLKIPADDLGLQIAAGQ